MTSRTKAAAAALAAVAIMVAGCGKSNVTDEPGSTSAPASSAPTSPPAAAAAATITIDGFKFTDVAVPPGARVTVVNNDSAEHSVTSDTAGAFGIEVESKGQATFTAPTQPGTYPFHCTYHPSMHGTLTVQ